ncbi:hypothetical protein FGG08_001862 [Glutinoglossum americanum]|uniref:Chorismate synthase protein n=1 Tax=Glutinoglossum americanum TaxID=1670608 RepID=A0A9P8I5V3_9PEZI|nr:hypothetical protein FGG08_001862 [Glutinoglossum americanum]
MVCFHSSIKSLLITFGPFIITRAIGYLRSPPAYVNGPKRPIRPVPPHVSRALNILFITACFSLLSTFPYFQPENIFVVTHSRLQTPSDVLFARLQKVRPLTSGDTILKSKLVSMDARLLYLTYGPSPLAECTFCNSNSPFSYLYYSFPSIVAPHILHIAVLGVVTSSLLSGREGNFWRSKATIAGVGLALAEISAFGTYNYKNNSTATRPTDLDAFHWRIQVYRGVAIALIDALLAWGLYLSSTNRKFVQPFSPAERLESATRTLEAASSRLRADGALRSAVVRDEVLRGKMQSYWVAEGNIMGQIYEEPDVLDSVNGALRRLNVQQITEEAGRYADGVIGALPGLQPEVTLE